jgi:membrane-bound lytic murein transglycosylase D
MMKILVGTFLLLVCGVFQGASAQDEIALQKDQILTDVANRIAPEFHIPSGLEKRVGFWFDVYSKYSAEEHVLHHDEYPWIIFSVVSTKDLPENPNNRWSKFHKSKIVVQAERQRVRKILLKLSKRKSFENLNEDEARFVEMLKEVEGKRSKVYKQAAYSLRSQLGQKDFMVSGISTSQKYFPYIEPVFVERGLPLELTRLPLVESSFNEAAVSKVGASGIWQLMPAIGKKFLKMSAHFDERNSPMKATEAAARLLKQNYTILKTWPLALTAYNHGPGGLIRAQKKLGTNDISTIVEDYNSRSFGFASSNFFSSFLAALHVEKYQKELFGDLPGTTFPELKFVELTQTVKLKSLIAAVGLEASELRAFNLDIKEKSMGRNTKLPRGYRLLVPIERKAQLEAFLESLPTKVSQRDIPRKNRSGI